MSERGFLIFSIYLLFFSEFSCPSWVWTEVGSKFFFFLFLSLSHPVLAINNAGKSFFFYNFEFFCYFFRNFLSRVKYERNSGLLFSLSWPITSRLARNSAEKRFFYFLNYFAIFFGILLPGLSMNGIQDKNFFLSFSAYLILFWLKIMSERGF